MNTKFPLGWKAKSWHEVSFLKKIFTLEASHHLILSSSGQSMRENGGVGEGGEASLALQVFVQFR